MPHLCPMNWAIALFFFWFLLLLVSTTLWWHQLPTFPLISPPSSSPPTPWNWA